jgi:hypothetical protein
VLLSTAYIIYVFFTRILEDEAVTNEDKSKIKGLLAKPFNPYIRRHSALTEKSIKLKFNTLNQHAGWSMNSNMAQYTTLGMNLLNRCLKHTV